MALNVMELYEGICEFILIMTMPGALDGEEQ